MIHEYFNKQIPAMSSNFRLHTMKSSIFLKGQNAVLKNISFKWKLLHKASSLKHFEVFLGDCQQIYGNQMFQVNLCL